MTNMVLVNNHKIVIREYRGQRVITFREIDEVHDRPKGTSSRNFYKSTKHFTEDKDYFKLSLDEIRRTGFDELANPMGVNLITKSGYLMLVKSLTDDLAWEVQRQLVDTYFQSTPQQVKPMNELQILRAAIDQIEVAQQTATQALHLAESHSDTIQNIKDTMSPIDKEWRRWANKRLQQIGFKTGDYQGIKHESYTLLEVRAHCNLERRLENLRNRLRNAAATRTKINSSNYLDVIETDPKLKEIYSAIVKELSIKYVA